ncbi:MAG: hypothetical protein AB7U73_25615 [Pirellulales bacterium]
MRRHTFWIVALAVTLAIPAQTWAQRPGGGQGRGRGMFGGGTGMELFLLGQDSVQKELSISEEQAAKARELGEKQRESFGNFRELSQEERRAKMEENRKALESGLAEILKPEQAARLKQIALQQRGPSAIGDPTIAATLDLSADQKQQVETITRKGFEEMRGLREGGAPAAAREKFQALRKAQGDKLIAVLTPVQQSKWNEMVGPPFTGEIERPRFGGPGGPGGPGADGPGGGRRRPRQN